MTEDKIVVINGRKYDAKTGLPLPDSAEPTKKTLSSTRVHTKTQRAKTIARRVAKRPDAPKREPLSKRAGRVMDIARSSKISRFAPAHVATSAAKQPARKTAPAKDLPPQKHPVAEKARSTVAAKAKPTSQTAAQIKRAAIDAAMASAPSHRPGKQNFFKRHPRSITIVAVSVVVLLVGGYLTYVNMPNLSVQFAAMQAGISATYPEHRPDGYRISGPVSFSDGEVVIHFQANTGSAQFTIRQKESSWDSSAVLDNIVRRQAGEEYFTSQEKGLTIYIFRSNGAWVNDGILYTIEGDAPLTHEQIRRIATSM